MSWLFFGVKVLLGSLPGFSGAWYLVGVQVFPCLGRIHGLLDAWLVSRFPASVLSCHGVHFLDDCGCVFECFLRRCFLAWAAFLAFHMGCLRCVVGAWGMFFIMHVGVSESLLLNNMGA